MRNKLGFVGVVIAVFALAVLVPRVRAVNSDASPYGDWMGVVSVSREVPDGTLHPRVEHQGNAVMHVVIKPVWFSVLDRIQGRAELIDDRGAKYPIYIGDLSYDWELPVRADGRLPRNVLDGTLIGAWNAQFAPFELVFDRYKTSASSTGPSYRVQGQLSRGDAATLRSLVQSTATLN